LPKFEANSSINSGIKDALKLLLGAHDVQPGLQGYKPLYATFTYSPKYTAFTGNTSKSTTPPVILVENR